MTNEYELGDFGMGGMHLRQRRLRHAEQDLHRVALRRARHPLDHARPRAPGRGRARAHYETLDGDGAARSTSTSRCSCRRSRASGSRPSIGPARTSRELFPPNGFMKVDADYTPKPYEAVVGRRLAEDVPVAGVPERLRGGIAFAPPHAISRPRQTPSGTPIAPAPPRTGMPSAMIGKAVARSIVDMLGGAPGPTHTASMAHMGAACVASAGAELRSRAPPRR